MRNGVMALLVLLLAACNHGAPAGVLQKDTMEVVLWDMIKADHFATQYLMKDSASRKDSLPLFEMYDKVFQVHKITRDQFKKSYDYYVAHPDEFKDIADSLNARAGDRREKQLKLPEPMHVE